VLAKAALLCGHLALLIDRGNVIIVVYARARLGMRSFAFTTSSGTKSVELGGELGLRLDERAAVIAHRLVAGIGVLGKEGESRRDEKHDEENQSKGSVVDEEDHTHNTSDDGGLLEDLSKHEHEECSEEVDSSNGNVETVGLLVHPRAKDRHADKESKFNQDKSDGLDVATSLRKSDEHGLDEDVDEPWDDEPVRGSLELDVEEAPLVECDRVRVQDVSGVLVHGDGALRNADDLGRGPSEDANHGEHGQDGKDSQTSRVAAGKLPEAENHHLREANENDTEEDAFENSLPAVAEVDKLVTLHFVGLDESLADELEGDDTQNGEEDEDDEEGISCEKDIGGLHASPESYTLNATEDEAVVSSLSFSSSGVTSSDEASRSTSSEV